MRKFFLALLTTFAVAVSPAVAADALKDVNPAPIPGEQILMKAELPVQTGDARRGDVKLDESQTETMDFWFFLPSDESAKSDDGFPLMLFLHGAGERGDDPNVVKNHGPAKLCANPEIAKSWKFMTVSPQCKPNRFWSPLQLIELIDRVCESYPVDRSRIYVTGLSMGGFGTWSVASLAADKIAAIVPICGWYAPERAATITMPVWAFHGDADPAVNINSGRAIVEAVREAGNPEVIFTVYPGVNHDSWTRTYANPIIYDWLLSKRLPPTIESPKPVPGKQLAASAKLPAKAGNAFRGDDRLDRPVRERLNRHLDVLGRLLRARQAVRVRGLQPLRLAQLIQAFVDGLRVGQAVFVGLFHFKAQGLQLFGVFLHGLLGGELLVVAAVGDQRLRPCFGAGLQ